MQEQLTIELHNRVQAWTAIKMQLFPFLKCVLQGENRWLLTVTRRKRTVQQNRRYFGNGVLKQVSDQAIVNGQKFSTDAWHEMFKRMFLGLIELPDGSLSGKSSADLTTVKFSEFCSQVEAYAAGELGVTFTDLEQS